MIIGIGTDLVDIRRVEKTLKKFGDKFTMRVFTEQERTKALGRKGKTEPAATLAKRFAAKEACIKALGGSHGGVSWQEMEIISDAHGKPQLLLTGATLKAANALIPAGKKLMAHVSYADDYPYAQAFVVLSAE